MLRAETDVQILISIVRFHFRKVITLIHATSENTFQFRLALATMVSALTAMLINLTYIMKGLYLARLWQTEF